MTIKQRHKGFQLDITHNKTRYRPQFNGSKDEAMLAEAQIKKGLSEGKDINVVLKEIDVSRHNLSIGAIYARMKNKYTDRHSQRTAENIILQLGTEKRINQVDEDIVDELVESWQEKGNSPATCNRKLAALSKILSWAHKRHYIKSKPQFEWFMESAGRIRYFKDGEDISFCNYLYSNQADIMADMTYFCNDTGLRKSEAKNIDANRDVDKGKLTVLANKNKLLRTIPLTERALKILKKWGNTPFALVSDEYLRKTWNYGKIRMGYEHDKQFTFHMTRHTCASRLIQRGVGITVVKEWLGHKTIKMTLRYAHLAPNNFHDAKLALESCVLDGVKLAVNNN